MQGVEFKPRWGHYLKLSPLIPLGEGHPNELVFKCISDYEPDIIRDEKSKLIKTVHFVGGYYFTVHEHYPQVFDTTLKEICVGKSDSDSCIVLIFEK